ncbi:hypothetical protein [Actinoplanes sp. NPDC048796]|uniref:hypothetical protein n=1 Tax=unclassified Actinoplanes TaxID=2626549 RepID=UPI0033EAC066
MDAGFSADRRAGQYDMNYFSMLRQFLYGGGRLWFEDIFSVSGFLVLNPRSHRLYVTEGATGEIIGIDLPLTEADGTVSPGRGGTFPSVLPSLIEYDGLKSHRPVASRDDYCARIYDLSEWI